jgi:hypothetical protein
MTTGTAAKGHATSDGPGARAYAAVVTALTAWDMTAPAAHDHLGVGFTVPHER